MMSSRSSSRPFRHSTIPPALKPRWCPRLEILEDRLAPATGPTLVTNLADSGAGSFRQALINAQNDVAADTITFAPGLFGQTINLNSVLPTLTNPLSIVGPAGNFPGGGVTLNGPNAFNMINIIAGGTTFVFSNLTITGGNAGAFGGGAIAHNNAGGSLTLNNVVLQGNTANAGGGLANFAGTVTINNSTIANNTAPRVGGTPGLGGGIAALGGVTNLFGTTVSGNGVTGTGSLGGGIGVAGATLNVVNSTIANNTVAAGGNGGGGITQAVGGETVNLLHATIVGNIDNSGLGGGIDRAAGAAVYNITNSILSQNTGGAAPNVGRSSSGTNVGNFISQSNPQLTPLQNNGGLTQTMAPLSGSPVIDTGVANPVNPITGGALTVEQRFFPGVTMLRQIGAATDRGAVEFQPPANVTTLSVVLGASTPLGQLANLTANVQPQSPAPNDVPAGQVLFVLDGAIPLGAPVNLDGTGTATLANALIPPGSHTVTALYSGDVSYAATNSAPVGVTATATPLTPAQPTVLLKTVGGRPQVQVYDGATNALRFSAFPFPSSFRGKARFALIDVNNDGMLDVVTTQKRGPGFQGRGKIYHGLTGAVLRSFKAKIPSLAVPVRSIKLTLGGFSFTVKY